jgi:hypothetical protein
LEVKTLKTIRGAMRKKKWVATVAFIAGGTMEVSTARKLPLLIIY